MATTYVNRSNGRPPLTINVDTKQDSRKQQSMQMQYESHQAGMDDDMEDEDEEDEESDEMRENGLRVVNGEEQELDDNGSFSDSLSSSPSIPDEDIDFTLVYALHTFLATVDGQASVVKGDKLYLLDDSNSYWWLVRVLKTQAVGYIPAENIETPYERLARLNKHRNVDLTSATQEDHITGPNSTAAQTRFETRIPPSQQPHPHRSQHPSSKGVLADPTHKDHPRNISPTDDRPASRKGKTVIFTAPTYYEHSANGESEDYGDDDEEEMMGDQNFEDEGDEESEFSDDNLTEDGEETRGVQIQRRSNLEDGEDGGDEDDQSWEDEGARNIAHEQAEAEWRAQQSQHRPLSPQQQQSLLDQQQLHRQQDSLTQRTVSPQNQLQYQHQQQQIIQQQHEQRASLLQRRPSDSRSIEVSPGSRNLPELEEEFNPDLPTKKLSATPPIVRDLSFDMSNPFGDQPGGARSASPLRVRGVEVVDVRDPRYGKLISDRREVEKRPVMDRESLNNSSTSVESGFAPEGSEDGKRDPSPISNKLQKKASRESVDGITEKKRKSGILSLFRKKDKKKKEKDENNEYRSSEEGGRPSASSFGQRVLNGDYNPDASNELSSRASKREPQTAESMFSTESALRQQQVEAKQAMYHQYGVQRQPGDLTNTMTPRVNSQTLTPIVAPGATPARMRPGSLIGSPSIPGLDVPLLSVLRVFAGDNIESDATFKTVLLNRLTSSSELVKQSMQRFRLAGLEEQEEYYLTVRELGGEERPLEGNEKPLVLFEELGDNQDGFAIPSVNRSSVGSISSIRSNLSLNPAITRLGMNDFSDDSAVKFFLNRRSQIGAPVMEQTHSMVSDGSLSGPSLRFAIRILIHPSDLPDNVVFDPSSQSIISRSVLEEREKRQGFEISLSPEPRERIIFFPKNVNVSDVVEAGLDRFGIVDGVVGGGDEVEDRISKRRSVLRVKYGLAFTIAGKETPLNASTKILEAYSTAPLFKPYDRTTKEFRRRSVDATLILGSPDDVQYSDPIFVIRRSTPLPLPSTNSPGPIPKAVDELIAHQALQHSLRADSISHPPTLERSITASSSVAPSVYTTPMEELSTPFESNFASAPSPPPTRQEIITAQRAASRASQNAILSAQKNSEQGVDITLLDRATIRSSRNFSDDRVSYSYIDGDGDTTDISDHIQTEWSKPKEAESPTSAMTTNFSSDSFLSALSSPGEDGEDSQDLEKDREDQAAVDSLKLAPISIDNSTNSRSAPPPDLLISALGSRSSPTHPASPTESLQERLDRVLAKVKDDRAKGLNGRKSPDSRPSSRTRGLPIAGLNNSGRMSPLVEGRKSPLYDLDGRDSPSIDQIMNGTNKSISTPLIQTLKHSQQTSIGSISSTAGSSSIEGGFSTRNIHSPTSSTTLARGESRNDKPFIAYKEDFGLEIMINMIDGEAKKLYKRPVKSNDDKLMESIFGKKVKEIDLHPQVRELYADQVRQFDDLDQRLDLLLQKFV